MEPTATPAPSGRRPAHWIGLGVVAALAVGGAALTSTATGDDPPDRWDRRVADLVAFVEDERGLEFDHPVATEFLPADEFREQVTDDEELSKDDAEDLEHYEGLFRALGLVEGDVDLREASNQISGEGIIGLYLPEEDRILVRGNKITVGMRPTIVHELTHALQAQHFDMDLDRETSGEDTAFRALVEADALRIENAYVDSLPDDERDAVDREQQAQADDADFEGVPLILTELFSLPYVLGPPFLDAVETDGGARAIDRTFRKPPTTEEHLLDPVSFLDDDEPVEVTVPRLRAGEKQVDEPDDFGMLSMLLVLGERLPFPQAWAAVDGWAGDASITYRAKGKDCIRVRTRLDTAEDAGELLSAARAWVGDRKTASTERSGRTVDITSCDPGKATTPSTGVRVRTFDLMQLRIELVGSLEANGVPHAIAVCTSDAVLRDHKPEDLIALNTIEQEDDPRIVALQRYVADRVERCAGGG